MKFRKDKPSEFLKKLEDALDPEEQRQEFLKMQDAQRQAFLNTMAQGVRTFDTGATRDVDHDKIDPEGFLSPEVIERFCQYMHTNRYLKDGSMRASDNWTKGIPRDAYVKSLWRHFLTLWKLHRQGVTGGQGMEDTLCALIFNSQGYLFEVLRGR